MPEQSPTGSATSCRHAWVHTLEPGAEGSASIRPVEGGWPGTDLVIKVNGVRIAARGGNWGMDDSRKRVSVEHLEPYFRLHRDAHVNMIRNWMGQNTEENFYALADKYGLMVWNDFWESTQNYNLEARRPGAVSGERARHDSALPASSIDRGLVRAQRRRAAADHQ